MSQFWKEKPLKEMTTKEWESLCDGCARCCLIKLRDDITEEVVYTDVACPLLDIGVCRCKNYNIRQHIVPECMYLRDHFDDLIDIMPNTCAYKLIHQGKDLYDWHYLISGDTESVHEAGISVRGKVNNETGKEDFMEHTIDWIDYD